LDSETPDYSEYNKKEIQFNELHVRKVKWELKVLDQAVSVAMDRMNVARALYSRQTY